MITLIATLLRSLSLISVAPGWGVKGEAIAKVLDLAAVALERGEEGKEQLEALAAEVRAMVNEGRQPTIGEWAALKKRSDEASAILAEHVPAPKEAAPAKSGKGKAKGADDAAS